MARDSQGMFLSGIQEARAEALRTCCDLCLVADLAGENCCGELEVADATGEAVLTLPLSGFRL